MSVRTRLIDTYYAAATGSRKLRMLLTPLGVLLFFAVIVLLIFLFLCLDGWLHFPPFPLGYWNLVLSAPFLAAGLAMVVWSNAKFLQVKGTPVPLNPPPRVVTTGPYAYVRNPMLSGLFLLLGGVGILLRSISLTFLFTPLFVLFNVWEIRAIEEPELEKRLGEEYVAYRQRTPRFFPRLTGRGRN